MTSLQIVRINNTPCSLTWFTSRGEVSDYIESVADRSVIYSRDELVELGVTPPVGYYTRAVAVFQK